MQDKRDAFGRALMDWAHGGTDPEVYERDDGYLDIGAGHEFFLAGYRAWPVPERRAMRYVRGRAVDVGCGWGRVALHLQQRGHDVVAVDSSPLAAKVARRQGVEDTWCLSIDKLTPHIGEFDTAVLFGNNLGIFGTPDRLRRILTTWATRMPTAARHPGREHEPVRRGRARDRSQLLPPQPPAWPHGGPGAVAGPLPGLGHPVVPVALRVARRDAVAPARHGLAPGACPGLVALRPLCRRAGEGLRGAAATCACAHRPAMGAQLDGPRSSSTHDSPFQRRRPVQDRPSQ